MGTLTLGRDGDYFKVLGTDGIDEIASLGKGTEVTLEFEDVLTITHHATGLICPNSEDITTYAGQVLKWREYDTGKWRLVGGAIVPHDHTSEEGGGEIAGEAIRDNHRGLVIHNTSGQEDTQVDVNADELVFHDSSGVAEKLTDIDLTIDNANDFGINKLDTGSVEANQWYYIWVVKGTTGNGGLFSLSPSLSTILGNAPDGYNDSAALVSAIRTETSTTNFRDMYQIGNVVSMIPTYWDRQETATTYNSFPLSSLVPITAKILRGVFRTGGYSPGNDDTDMAGYIAARADRMDEINIHVYLHRGTMDYETVQIRMVLVEPQRVYLKVSGGASGKIAALAVTGWEY